MLSWPTIFPTPVSLVSIVLPKLSDSVSTTELRVSSSTKSTYATKPRSVKSLNLRLDSNPVFILPVSRCDNRSVNLPEMLSISFFSFQCARGSVESIAIDFLTVSFFPAQAVGESTKKPLLYYDNNLSGTFVLLRMMDEFQCHSLVFSSSATVYGAAENMPITEDTPVGAGITNAYGRTKYMIEEILRDFYQSQTLEESTTDWSITILRYFNPVGSHPSGKIGEDPNGIPNNLMPYVAQVAIGRREHLTVFGSDYNTADGTGVRDYLHVMDLADGHLAAMDYMKQKKSGIFTFNLGTGNGYSVLDMVKAMGKACGHEIKYVVGNRRQGDIATCFADANLAKNEMGWVASRDLDEMCRDLWCWQTQNPNGFAGQPCESQ
jgi:UDP-glucose 4-epimerase